MSKRETRSTSNKNTPKAKKIKQLRKNDFSQQVKSSIDNDKSPMKQQIQKQKQTSKIPLVQPSNLRKSQLKKQVSINSQNFVMCKITDFQADYEIVGKLGQGSFGTVFRVRHRTLKLDRALKKIKKNPTSKFSSVEQIQVLKKLDHVNILKIYQFYESDQYYMIVTDIFEGRQLFDQIIDADKISEEISSRIIRQVLITLNYTHSLGIAHRDVKPQNILVRNIMDKDKFKMKIIDWGLGTLMLEQYSDRVCGTPQYAAPQIFQGKYSLLCDMWSLGVLTFIMLTGNMPFKGTNTQQTIMQVKRCIINHRKTGYSQLSTNAKDFITNLIQKDPKKRMTAAKALQHPWIKQYYKQKSQPIFLKQTLQRLKQLNISNHFGVAVVNLINNHFSTNQERQKLQQIFQFLDSNGDGVLSKQQLIQGYSKIYGKQLALKIASDTFSKLDVNNSGTLQYSEFVAYGIRRQKEKEKLKLKQAFVLFDGDKNGSISWKQVSNILQGKLEGLYQDDMKQMLKQLDKNKDQEITFEQFYQFMQNMLEKVQVIRQSKKRQSQIRQSQKKQEQQKRKYPQVDIKLKKTESIDQPLEKQPQKIIQQEKNIIQIDTKNKNNNKKKKQNKN